jgi:predicted signal transduction protein with EAL and GGDEF domain
VRDYRFTWEGKVFTVAVSIGLATITSDTMSRAEVLSMADTACYWAKEQGRNRISVYHTGDSDMAARRRETGWVARINRPSPSTASRSTTRPILQLNAQAVSRPHLEVS